MVGLIRNISHLLAALFNNRADFHRRWKETPPRPNPGVWEGQWEGEWISQANGHRGALKCLLTKTSAGEYRAMFHAVYAGFLTVCYTVPLHGRETAGNLKLDGQADLGALAGGIYHYDGEASPAAFNCAYRCKYDHGTFNLKPLE